MYMGGIWEISAPSNFPVNLKLLKKKSLNMKERKEGRKVGRKGRKWVEFFIPSPLPALTRWKTAGSVAESPCGMA